MDSLNSFTILGELVEKFPSRFSEEIIVEFKSKAERENWAQKIKQLNIPSQKEGDKAIAIDIRKIAGFYYNRDDFKLRATQETFKNNIYVLKDTLDKKLMLTPSEALLPIKTTDGKIDYFYLNVHYYPQILQEYKDLHVSSYNNDARREFVLLSPNKKEFFLGYTRTIPNFDKIDLSQKFSMIKSISKAPEFLAFFKDQTINRLEAVEDREMRFVEFIKNIEQIASSANTDFEVFLKKFDFEAFKKNFRKERDEYFSRLREVLGSLLSKVVSIPVSISAAALALYNVSSDLLASSLIILGAVILSVLTSWLIRGLHEDTILIQNDFCYEVEILKQASLQSLSQTIKKESDKVSAKIKQLVRYIFTLQLFLTSSSAIALWVYFYQILKFNNFYAALIIAAVADIQLMFCFYNLEKVEPLPNEKKGE